MSITAQYEDTDAVFALSDAPTTGSALPGTDPSALGNRPISAYLQAETEDIRFTTDGTVPTASYGALLVAGADPWFYSGPLNQLKFLQAGSGAVLNVIYSDLIITTGSQGASVTGAQGAAGAAGAQGATGASGSGVRLFKKVINYTDFSAGTPFEVPLYTITAPEVCMVAMLKTTIEWNDTLVETFMITKAGLSTAVGPLTTQAYTVETTNVAGLMPFGGNSFGGSFYGPPFTPITSPVNLVVRAQAYTGNGTAGQLIAYLLLATPVAA